MLAPTLPKIIWMLWLQGWKQAPAVVRSCLKTWQVHNPDWTIRALSARNLGQYVDVRSLAARPWWARKVPPAALSDLVRVALLARHGGVWADGTVYCLKPLDAWLPEKFASGFFAFAKPGPDRMLSSWFLAASPGHYIVEEWSWRAAEYWRRRRKRDHYFWFHYLFAEAYRGDAAFRDLWDSTPEVSADGPHYYTPYEKLTAPLSSRDLRMLDAPPMPVLKLTHKLGGQDADESVVRHLCTRADLAWQWARAARDACISPPRDLPLAG